MARALLANLKRFAPGRYRPSSFLQRGVAVPFGNPSLAGTRIRPGERHRELVMLDPRYGQGQIVLPWRSLPELCTLREPDVALWEALHEAAVLTPPAVRRVVRQMGLQGSLGAGSQQAALAAEGEEQEAQATQNFRLLLRLVRQTEQPREAALPLARDSQHNILLRAQRAIRRSLRTVGCSADQLSQWLSEIAGVVQLAGLGPERRGDDIGSLLARLRQLREDLAALQPGREVAPAVWLLDEMAGLNIACAAPLLQAVERQLDRLPQLLRRWRNEPALVTAEFERPSWLLDGWGEILALWDRRGPQDTDEVLRAMAAMVPLLPREIIEWTGLDVQFGTHQQRLNRWVGALEDWRTGRIIDLRDDLPVGIPALA